MKTLRRWFLATVFLFAVTVPPLRAVEPDPNPNTIYQKTLRATALVIASKGQGTGWVVNKARKQLVTSQHVAGRGETVQVLFPAYRDGHVIAQRAFYKKDAQVIRGKVIRSDARRDLALIQLDSLPQGVAELKLAGEIPGPGDSVHTVGCPGRSAGLWVYSYGRVRQVVEADWTDSSRTERSAQVVESQIAINPGDSGGPLVNDRAELVGVNHGGQPNAQLLTLSIATGEVRQLLAAKDDAPVVSAKDYFRLAAEHKIRKEWDKAKENLMQGLLLEPENTKAMAELAWVLNELKEYDNAIELCGILLQIDQRNASGWRKLGYALLKKEKYEQSAKALVLALVLDRKNPSVREYLEQALAGLEREGNKELAGKLREVVKELDKAAEEPSGTEDQ